MIRAKHKHSHYIKCSFNSCSEAGRCLNKQWEQNRVFDGGQALIPNLPEDNKHRLVGFNRDWDAANRLHLFNSTARKTNTGSRIIWQKTNPCFCEYNVPIAHYQGNETRTEACWNQDVVNGAQDFYCVMLQMCAALTWGSVWSERDTGSRRPSEGPSALAASPDPRPPPDQWAPSLFSVQNNSTSKKHVRVVYYLIINI